MPEQKSTIGSFPLTLEKALETKKSCPLEFIRGLPLYWQLVYSYTYSRRMTPITNFHTQDYNEIIVYLRSGRRFLAGSRVLEAQYGDLLIFPAGVPHMGIDLRTEPYERYYIFINPELLDYLPDGEAIAACFREDSPNLIRFDSQLRDSLLAELSGLQRIDDFTPSELFRLRITIMRLLCELSQHHQTQLPADGMPPLLSQIVRHMNDDFASIPTSASVAKRFGISESYMSRLFRESLQISPYQYLQSLRLFEAKRLLSDGASVTEACFSSGFGDCSHFIAYFKRSEGVTPAEYKNRSRDL